MSMLIRRGFFCARQAHAAHWLWCGNAAPAPSLCSRYLPTTERSFSGRLASPYPSCCKQNAQL
jgi:hypothetical protein